MLDGCRAATVTTPIAVTRAGYTPAGLFGIVARILDRCGENFGDEDGEQYEVFVDMHGSRLQIVSGSGL